MVAYRYEFYSLITERIIAELPLYGVDVKQVISGAGNGTGSFNLDQTGLSNEELLEATVPGRTAVAVLRNDVPVWTGITWSRTYQSQAKSVQMYFWGFECYPSRQLMTADATYTEKRVNVFLQLWRDMQAVSGRNLGINIPANIVTSGSAVSVTYQATDRKFFSELMTSLADVKDDGFDWTIDVARDGATGLYLKTLRVGYPHFGAIASPSALVFDYPGNILNYYATESMGSAATHTTVVGAGEGTDSPTYTYARDDLITYGWPRWDLVLSRKDTDSLATVQGLAQQEGFNRTPPNLVIKATVKAGADPEFGSYAVGDNCNLSINDPRFPGDGLLLPTRITEWELTPQSADSTEEVSLTFAMELDDE